MGQQASLIEKQVFLLPTFSFLVLLVKRWCEVQKKSEDEWCATSLHNLRLDARNLHV